MNGRHVILDEVGDREAAALVVDGRIDDLLVEGPEEAPVVGAIYRARADRPMKGQGGMTLRLPDGHAFLRQTRGLSPGERLLVQVTGHAEAGKAVPVTTKLLFKGRFALITPGAPGRNVSRQLREAELRGRLQDLADAATLPEGAGLILRSACGDAEDEQITTEIAQLSEIAAAVLSDSDTQPELLLDGPGPHELAWRDWPAPDALDEEPGAFDRHGVDEMIEALRRPEVPLGGQAWMSIEPTRALVAVDVNTGGDTSPAAALKANIAAARELPRQLRCRGLGGQITVDFAPISKKDRQPLEQALEAAFRADPVATTLSGWTTLSHFEMQRKRERLPLAEVLP